MRVAINLASHPYEDIRRFWLRWGGALAALGLLTIILLYLAIAGWYSASKDRQLMNQREAQIAERDKERGSAEAMMNLPQNHDTRDRSQFLNELFQRKAFSWTRVFEDLEKVMPPRLHVVSIHPELDADNQLEIKLKVAGESRERAIELVQRMEGSARFHGTRVGDETTTQTQNPEDKVTFDISAFYVPEAEAERVR